MTPNPYRDWLGIRSNNPCPTPYELLGLDECEQDPQKIHDAYARQMAVVRRFQVGRHMDLAQRVISELSEAYVQLKSATEQPLRDTLSQTEETLAKESPPIERVELPKSPEENWARAMVHLTRHRQTGDENELEAGKLIAAAAFGDEGVLRFKRLALRWGVRHEEFRNELCERALSHGTSVCGHCFEEIPPLEQRAMHVALDSSGSIHSDYASILQRRQLFSTELSVRSASGQIRIGSCVSKSGALIAASVLTIVPLLCNLAAGWAGLDGTGPVSLFLLAVCIGALVGVQVGYRPRYTDALDTAWNFVVPSMIKSDCSAEAESFVTGLALFSEGRGAPDPRARALEELIKYLELRASSEPTLLPLASVIQRLRLSDLIRQRKTQAAVELLSRFIQECITGERPPSLLDLITYRGGLIACLPPEAQRILKWRLYTACDSCGMSPHEVLSLEHVSTTLSYLLHFEGKDTVSSVSHALAVVQVMKETAVDSSIRFAPRLTLTDHGSDLDRLQFASVWSADGTTLASEKGLYFRGRPVSASSKIKLRRLTRFIQTGWTYQRADGGPDQRYKHNPPVGYREQMGYLLTVDGETLRFTNTPFAHEQAALAMFKTLVALKKLYFGQIAPRAVDIAFTQDSGRTNLQTAVYVKCPHCRQTVSFLVGQIATPRTLTDTANSVHYIA